MTRRPTSGIPPAEVKAEINVTPLVDVCLVLLIIFMVVTPLIRQGVAVELPETAAPEGLGDSAGKATLTIRSDRSVWLEDERLEAGSLAAAWRRRVAASPGIKLVVRGDRTLRYADVLRVLRELAQAGLSDAELATLRRSDAASN